MNYNINISNNTFNDNSSAVKNIYNQPQEVGFTEIINEIERLKNTLNPNISMYKALDELECSIKKDDKKSIQKTIKKHISDFSSSLFAGIASSIFIEFVKSFL